MKMISLMQIVVALLVLVSVLEAVNIVIYYKLQLQQQYNSGYEQGTWDSFIYSDSHFGGRGVLSFGFRKHLKKTKPNLQTTEEMWKLEDKYLEGLSLNTHVQATQKPRK